jgi:2-isopropylmalate synthase
MASGGELDRTGAGGEGRVAIYDTTLRDGAQGEGISFSSEDKLKILRALDLFGVDYVEGGWPGSNPKDIEFFRAARALKLSHSRLAAFGSTTRPGKPPEEDQNLRAIIEVEAPVVTIFGKSWRLHVTEVLRTSLEENLRMIEESVRFLRQSGREVIYDAEHFFDGFADDPGYALSTLEAAFRGGARCLVLCDTNGGALTHVVGEVTAKARERLPEADLGIHTHNDGGLAAANSLEAVRQGAVHVQGTFNGLGERCGNADLTVVIPNLVLKMGRRLTMGREELRGLTRTARYVSAIANHNFPENHPYIGQMAFAHKGGVHVNSVMKVARSYEHIDPELVGNSRRVLLSELSGRSNVEFFARQEGIDLAANAEAARAALEEIKRLESQGYVFEGAEASSAVILLKALGRLPTYFELVSYRTTVQHSASPAGPSRGTEEEPGELRNGRALSEATVKIRVGGEAHLAVGEGVGPVDALDAALRAAIKPFFPEVDGVRLSDYKVRVINADAGTHAKVRVLIESTDSHHDLAWGTVGASDNIIEASWVALRDSIIYGIYRARSRSPSLKS